MFFFLLECWLKGTSAWTEGVGSIENRWGERMRCRNGTCSQTHVWSASAMLAVPGWSRWRSDGLKSVFRVRRTCTEGGAPFLLEKQLPGRIESFSGSETSRERPLHHRLQSSDEIQRPVKPPPPPFRIFTFDSMSKTSSHHPPSCPSDNFKKLQTHIWLEKMLLKYTKASNEAKSLRNSYLLY